ncbi:hypothetical protein SAMN05216344_112122 [Polaromonas sp. OV174]|uniref:hypothetical protein n=1 Tax=Polaromonas sp. OV174 TaxID=1855300 RepID=UPI0008E0508B|nr:hypothetical protein [Polaromonas sp. OV174]SFC26415.1 hypothetical protein SAMN05216344_112122 [Polaromonas sp. OV174]
MLTFFDSLYLIHAKEYWLQIEQIKKLDMVNMDEIMLSVDYLSHAFITFLEEETGASNMEYLLIGSMIAVVFALFMLALHKEI